MADFEVLAGIHQGLFLVLLIVMLLPTMMANRLVFRPTKQALTKGARITLCFLWSALFVFAGYLVMTWVLFEAYGWLYIKDKLIGYLPFLFAPLICCLLFTFPRLWELASRGSKESTLSQVDTKYHHILLQEKMDVLSQESFAETTDNPDAEWFGHASSPEMIIPMQASVLGGLIALILQAFIPAVTLEPSILFLAWGVYVAGVSLLWIRQSWRHQHHSNPDEWEIPPRLMTTLRYTGLVLFVAFIAMVWGNEALFASRDSTQADSLVQKQNDLSLPDFTFPVTANANSISPRAITEKGRKPIEQTIGVPDRTFSLTVQKASVGVGPELRIKQGELVEIELLNKDISDGVSLHLHGLHAANSQDPATKGEKQVYRFRAEQPGTFWYHSQQQWQGSDHYQLFGALVVEPADEPSAMNSSSSIRDITMLHHNQEETDVSVNGSGTQMIEKITPGTTVRLRLINVENAPVSYSLQGTPFQVIAIDGREVNEPNLIANQALRPGAGGRYDLLFTMPNRPVLFAPLTNDHHKGLLLSPDGSNVAPSIHADLPIFDPARYGSPTPLTIDQATPYHREYEMLIDGPFGIDAGYLKRYSTVNGKAFSQTSLLAKEGELIKVTFVNRSFKEQSIRLHGHPMLVLSRDGKKATGSPWWADTLALGPGETYEVAFRANNPDLAVGHSYRQGLSIVYTGENPKENSSLWW